MDGWIGLRMRRREARREDDMIAILCWIALVVLFVLELWIGRGK